MRLAFWRRKPEPFDWEKEINALVPLTQEERTAEIWLHIVPVSTDTDMSRFIIRMHYEELS